MGALLVQAQTSSGDDSWMWKSFSLGPKPNTIFVESRFRTTSSLTLHLNFKVFKLQEFLFLPQEHSEAKGIKPNLADAVAFGHPY